MQKILSIDQAAPHPDQLARFSIYHCNFKFHNRIIIRPKLYQPFLIQDPVKEFVAQLWTEFSKLANFFLSQLRTFFRRLKSRCKLLQNFTNCDTVLWMSNYSKWVLPTKKHFKVKRGRFYFFRIVQSKMVICWKLAKCIRSLAKSWLSVVASFTSMYVRQRVVQNNVELAAIINCDSLQLSTF